MSFRSEESIRNNYPEHYFLSKLSYRLSKAGFEELSKTEKYFKFPVKLDNRHLIMLSARVRCPYYLTGPATRRTLCLFSSEEAVIIKLMSDNITQWLETQDDYLH